MTRSEEVDEVNSLEPGLDDLWQRADGSHLRSTCEGSLQGSRRLQKVVWFGMVNIRKSQRPGIQSQRALILQGPNPKSWVLDPLHVAVHSVPITGKDMGRETWLINRDSTSDRV